MTMKKRLMLSFASILALMIIISIIGLERVGVMNHNLQDVSQGATLKQRYAINFRGSVHDRAISIRDAVLVDTDAALNKHLADVKRLDSFYQESAQPMKNLLARADATAEEKRLADAINAIEVDTQAATARLIQLRQQGQTVEAQQLLLTQVADKYSAWLKAINAFIDYQEAVIKGKVGEVEGVAKSFSLLMIVVTLIAIVLGVVLAATMVAYMNRVLGADPSELRNYALALAKGNFNSRFPSQVAAQSVLADLQLVQTNSQAAIEQVNLVVSAMAQGNFHQRIQGELQGDWQALKTGVNQGITQIEQVMEQMSSVMKALNEGQFAAQINTQAPGAFGAMLLQAQSALTGLRLVMDDVAGSIQKLSKGDFSVRVKAEACGDLADIKTTVNTSLDMLDQLTRELLAMAQAQMDGDMTVVIQGRYEGRFHELQQARVASTEKLRQVIAQAMEASQVVGDTSQQVAQGAGNLSARVQQQASALEEASATMHQITNAVQTNTDSATQVAQLAHQVQDQSSAGVAVMQQTIDAMKSIQAASSKIADIVSIIDSIAFQTNLLALNAAVEAARAGEHGRGFAVVASEVRALAGKSADAAKDIKSLIEDSVQRIHAGTQLADKSGEMLTSISQSVGQVASMIESISAASAEQTNGISQVHLAIADIDRVTQENSALVDATTQAAESLNQEASQLGQSMAFFKTGQSGYARPSVSRVVKSVSSSASFALPSPKKSASDEWSDF